MPDNEEICGAEIKSKPGKVCTNPANNDDGRCGFHTETSEVGAKTGLSNATNVRHGLNMDRSDYYTQLSDADKRWVDAIVQSFLDEAPFDESHHGKVELLRQVAIDFHKRRAASDIIGEEGLMVERIVGGDENGPFINMDEHPLHMAVDRLGRSNIRILKELGCLGNEDKTSEEAAETLIDILSGTAKLASDS